MEARDLALSIVALRGMLHDIPRDLASRGSTAAAERIASAWSRCRAANLTVERQYIEEHYPDLPWGEVADLTPDVAFHGVTSELKRRRWAAHADRLPYALHVEVLAAIHGRDWAARGLPGSMYPYWGRRWDTQAHPGTYVCNLVDAGSLDDLNFAIKIDDVSHASLSYTVAGRTLLNLAPSPLLPQRIVDSARRADARVGGVVTVLLDPHAPAPLWTDMSKSDAGAYRRLRLLCWRLYELVTETAHPSPPPDLQKWRRDIGKHWITTQRAKWT
jgi:hypothetical protein